MAVFPLKTKVDSYKTVGPCKFGAPRPNGRKHAGVDLGTPAGSPVFAMAKGTVIEASNRDFYTNPDKEINTGVVTVRHDISITIDGTEYTSFVVRYGEVNQVKVAINATVEEGTLLASVAPQANEGTELHMELYLGEQGISASSKFKGTKKPYMRAFNPSDSTSLLDSLNVKP
jgi:murein DD-endopeptidase MepM/ murein hydrolase activator NlpD